MDGSEDAHKCPAALSPQSIDNADKDLNENSSF